MIRRVLTFAVLPFLLVSCSANAFVDVYNDYSNGVTKETTAEFIPIIDTSSIENRVEQIKSIGYVVVGYANFESEWVPRAKAAEAARKKGADIVVISSKITGTEHRNYSIPIVQPMYQNYSGTVNTAYGYANYSGTVSYNKIGAIQASYSVVNYNQYAVFLRRAQDKQNGH